MTTKSIERFSFAERASHWISALCFLYAAFTGLALWSPRLFWLSGVFGGGETVRAWHPWAGLIFTCALGVMFKRWAGQMQLDQDDQVWLAKSHLYAQNLEVDIPESGRFNAGQKMMFWLQSASAFFLLLSGVVIWFPEQAPRTPTPPLAPAQPRHGALPRGPAGAADRRRPGGSPAGGRGAGAG